MPLWQKLTTLIYSNHLALLLHKPQVNVARAVKQMIMPVIADENLQGHTV